MTRGSAYPDISSRHIQWIAGMLPVLAAREVSQRGGGARRGSEAPELMSPAGRNPSGAGVATVIVDAFRTRGFSPLREDRNRRSRPVGEMTITITVRRRTLDFSTRRRVEPGRSGLGACFVDRRRQVG